MLNRTQFWLLSAVAWLATACGSQKEAIQEEPIPSGPSRYIEQYQELAVREMRRTGVPASITLAQGLLESGSGTSRLARQANNHFGIKCKRHWKGPTIRADDDAPDECFRAYENPEASFRDHSDFLVQGRRYDFLFGLDPTDYEAWAEGLRKAGYATNPRYDDLLISLIERYRLHRFDRASSGAPILPQDAFDKKNPQRFTFNGLEAVVVQKGDTYERLSEKWDVNEGFLRNYNDLEKGDPLPAGALLYLEPKHRKARDAEFHVLNEGESLFYVAQLYGVKYKKLQKYNRLEDNRRPAVGEKVYLRDKREAAPKLRLQHLMVAKEEEAPSSSPKKNKPQKPRQAASPEQKPAETPTDSLVNKTASESATLSGGTREESAPQAQKDPAPSQQGPTYTVQKGETLYAISRKTGVSVSDIIAWNNLPDASLHVGQVLRLSAPSKKSSRTPEASAPKKQKPARDTLKSLPDTGGQKQAKRPAVPDSTGARQQDSSARDTNNRSGSAETETPSEEPAEAATPKEPQAADPSPNRSSAVEGGFFVHQVAPGETLYSIAREYGVGVNNIAKLNQMESLDIEAGQKLKIPAYER